MPGRETLSEVTGVLLAGGRSARMGGREKAMIELAGEPLIAHAVAALAPQVGHLVINANGDPARYAFLGLPVVADSLEGHAGPLAGLQAGLAWARRETPAARFVATAPVDTPFLPGDLVARLHGAMRTTGASSAIAASRGERYPVAGIWDMALADALADALDNGMRAVHRFAEEQNSAVVDFPLAEIGGARVDPFFNINTPADLETAQALLADRARRAPRRTAQAVPLIGIVGWKGSGKTTLVERLVAELVRRGLKVATIKHSHHALRPRDGATDGERHARAGACATAVVGAEQWELAGELQASPPPGLEDLIARLAPADLILVEGWKHAPIPKIEVRRRASATQQVISTSDPNVIAVAADRAAKAGALPVFVLDDVDAIAAFILKTTGLATHSDAGATSR